MYKRLQIPEKANEVKREDREQAGLRSYRYASGGLGKAAMGRNPRNYAVAIPASALPGEMTQRSANRASVFSAATTMRSAQCVPGSALGFQSKRQ